jgi:LysM repeat protein
MSMARIKRGMLIASTLLLVMIITSACKQPYSQTAAETFTPVPQNNLFASAVPTGMGDVSAFATGSAIAQMMTTSPGAPIAATNTPIPGVTQPAVTATNTPLVVINPTNTSTLAVVNAATATPIPAGSGGSYTLQPGEFVYCIARRFNLDPDEILAVNGIVDSQTIYPGLTLKLPNTGHPFPGNRTLRTHPATYTVSQTDETVYSVACQFGDVDPNSIASANNISVGAKLSVGQALNIP